LIQGHGRSLSPRTRYVKSGHSQHLRKRTAPSLGLRSADPREPEQSQI